MDISSMLEVQVNEEKEVDSKENLTPKVLHPSTTNVPPWVPPEETTFYKRMFNNDISIVRFRRLHCTACDAHIGSAPSQADNMQEHPVLRTLLCLKCREFYGDGHFEQGDDATDMFCRWCANGGNLYCCSYCSNTFCSKCIKRNFDELVRKQIEADEEWKCFVCNPADLYRLRAVCWALLQHIETVNRILHKGNMTEEEFEVRMNLDEAQCCPRRRRRKRKRTSSNSDEEDATYIPGAEASTILQKRKIPKKSHIVPKLNVVNGTVNHSGDNVFFIKPENTLNKSEIPAATPSREKPRFESKGPIINLNNIKSMVQISSERPIITNLNPTITKIYSPTLMSVPTTFLQSTSSGTPVRQIVIPSKSTISYQSPSTPMVTIPGQNSTTLNRARVLLLKPCKKVLTTIAPNVIEIDSDSDTHASSTKKIDNNRSSMQAPSTSGAVPVALVSAGGTCDNDAQSGTPLRELRPQIKQPKSFNQKIIPHATSADFILTSLKTRLHDFFEDMKRPENQKCDISTARFAIKRFHRDIRNSILQLSHLNDRIVREFSRWRRTQKISKPAASTDKTVAEEENVDIPLDMTCVNDSSEEPEDCTQMNCVMNSCDLIQDTNALEGMRFFRKRDVVDRCVGDANVLHDDKSVQVSDLRMVDYERFIEESVLNADDYISKERKNSLPTEKFNKYEEEFLFYLQKAEDQRIEVNSCEELPNPNETPLKDLIEANSPFITEMLENMHKDPITNNSIVGKHMREHNYQSVKPTCSKTSEAVEENTITSEPVNELVNVEHAMNDKVKDTNDKNVANSRIRVRNESLKEMDCEELNISNMKMVDICTENEEDCTIIDE